MTRTRNDAYGRLQASLRIAVTWLGRIESKPMMQRRQ